MTAMSKQQLIRDSVHQLVKAGILREEDSLRVTHMMNHVTPPIALKILFHSGTLRIIMEKAKSINQSDQVKRGRLLGKLTSMLRPEDVAAGYCLMEDEDTLYLYLPDDAMMPILFNSHRVTMDMVYQTIDQLEGRDEAENRA